MVRPMSESHGLLVLLCVACLLCVHPAAAARASDVAGLRTALLDPSEDAVLVEGTFMFDDATWPSPISVTRPVNITGDASAIWHLDGAAHTAPVIVVPAPGTIMFANITFAFVPPNQLQPAANGPVPGIVAAGGSVALLDCIYYMNSSSSVTNTSFLSRLDWWNLERDSLPPHVLNGPLSPTDDSPLVSPGDSQVRAPSPPPHACTCRLSPFARSMMQATQGAHGNLLRPLLGPELGP